MSMSHEGLTKLMEECGELIQAAAKMLALQQDFPGQTIHWDRSDVRKRIEEEMGDVLGAIEFVIEKKDLSASSVFNRSQDKLAVFRGWDAKE